MNAIVTSTAKLIAALTTLAMIMSPPLAAETSPTTPWSSAGDNCRDVFVVGVDDHLDRSDPMNALPRADGAGAEPQREDAEERGANEESARYDEQAGCGELEGEQRGGRAGATIGGPRRERHEDDERKALGGRRDPRW